MTKIFIDQGHNPNGANAGAEGNGYREQDITYSIGVRLAERLRRDGYSVRLSRNSPDEQLGTSNASSLSARTNAANRWGADYFISLHANASSNTAASGTEAFVYRLGNQATPLAEDIVRGIVEKTGIPYRGVLARPTLYVLRKTRMPAVLVELGFITNPGDAALLVGAPQLFSDGIADGINRYFGM